MGFWDYWSSLIPLPLSFVGPHPVDSARCSPRCPRPSTVVAPAHKRGKAAALASWQGDGTRAPHDGSARTCKVVAPAPQRSGGLASGRAAAPQLLLACGARALLAGGCVGPSSRHAHSIEAAEPPLLPWLLSPWPVSIGRRMIF